MTTRKDRLKKLVKVQEQMKALHETRRATFLAEAASAEAEAKDLVEQFDLGGMSALFPELYHRRIANAEARKEAALEKARQEAALAAAATARTNMVERAFRNVRQHDERQRGDRERLEIIEQVRKEGE
jgi:hypothetical protein